MRSIRLSLLVYFLGLLAVALGVASYLVYRSAQRSLRDKEEATAKLIERRYQDSCREEREQLDKRLRSRAIELSKSLHLRMDYERLKACYAMQGLAAVGARTMPSGLPSYVCFLNLALSSRPSYNLFQSESFALEFRAGLAPSEDLVGEYYRIEAVHRGRHFKPLHSGSAEVVFPDLTGYYPESRFRLDLDDFDLPSGQPVRRVRFKGGVGLTVEQLPEWVTAGWQRPRGNGGFRPPGSGGGGRRWPWRQVNTWPVLYIQWGADTHDAEARDRANRELARLHDETQTALLDQRNNLLMVCGVTFLAAAFGSFVLVWLGLLPLHRLSEAVSKVSARDFRLQLGDRPLPRELRPIAERLSSTLDLLKRAFSREKQATADISHELRTPLAAMITTIELALRKQRSPEQYRELFEDCRLSAQQMNHIVERLLTLARLDAGVDRLRPQPVDVVELAEQCATVVRPLAEARGLQLAVVNQCPSAEQYGERPARMLTDPDKLREVVTNLLHNAIQYNRPDGRIDLTVARVNGHVRVEVHDTGIGIAPEARERIFERFYRVDPSRNADDLHAGLGLAIVKEYIDLMGGQITVDSQEGQGSTFRVELPVKAPDQAG